MVVFNEVTTKEEGLSHDDSPIFEYNKNIRAMRYPLFVLTYVGPRGNEILKHEIAWGLNDIEQEIKRMKANAMREKAGI